MNFYDFEQFYTTEDPNANAHNDWLFDSSRPVYGINVRDEGLAKRCVENICLQPDGCNGLSAIMIAIKSTLPPDHSMLVTDHVDFDTVGAMAILNLIKSDSRLRVIDRFIDLATVKCGNRLSGPDPFSLRERSWSRQTALDGIDQFRAIEMYVVDAIIPLGDKVDALQKWLITGEEPDGYRTIVEQRHANIVSAINANKIAVETYYDGEIAFVDRTNKNRQYSAIDNTSPVVIVLDSDLGFNGKVQYREFNITAQNGGLLDTERVLSEFRRFELGWYVDGNNVYSPRHQISEVPVDIVVEIVALCLS